MILCMYFHVRWQQSFVTSFDCIALQDLQIGNPYSEGSVHFHKGSKNERRGSDTTLKFSHQLSMTLQILAVSA